MTEEQPEHRHRGRYEIESVRARTVDILSDQFARDVLSLEEFEQLVEKAHQAETLAELQLVTRGFRSPGRSEGKPRSSGEVASRSRPSPSGLRSAPPGHPYAGSSAGPLRDSMVAVFGETKRTGHWQPARKTTVATAMGSVSIDLRDAALDDGAYHFDVYAVLGSVEFIAPVGLHVECGGSAILGSIDPGHPEQLSAPTDNRFVRLKCFSFLGEVNVDFRLPGESKREAKRRRKSEARERRRLAAGEAKRRRKFGRLLD